MPSLSDFGLSILAIALDVLEHQLCSIDQYMDLTVILRVVVVQLFLRLRQVQLQGHQAKFNSIVPGVHRYFKYGALSLTKTTIQITFESKATMVRWLLTIQCYDLHHIFIMLSSVVM